MKISELIAEDQIDEGKLKQALAGATLAATIMSGGLHHPTGTEHDTVMQSISAKVTADVEKQVEIDNLKNLVLKKYNIPAARAEEIVKLVLKHEKSDFPQAEDLLAIIGIESSFNPNAVSGLKHDKAVGLTQIRPAIWGITQGELKGNLDKQVGLGAKILNTYYKKLGSEEKAVHAYNVGLTNFKHHRGLNQAYVDKWKNEVNRYYEI